MVGGHCAKRAQQAMKLKRRVLLRNFETGDFFKTGDLWTKDQNEALDFERSVMAISVARELRLQNIEVVHVSEDGTPFLETRLNIDA